MGEDVYQRLARHLDGLPARFPATESGVEFRILKQLFTPDEAELALHLNLIAEPAHVVAHRARIPVEQARQMLQEMAHKGLVYDRQSKDGEIYYMATQFVIGIWEYQVNRLNEDLVHDVDAYFEEALKPEDWGVAPQLRTIPIGESLPAQSEVMPYEAAAELLRRHTRFAVAPCICRLEMGLADKACDKPVETCLMMGSAADYYVRHGKGRSISLDEALGILELSDETGLVLQPSNYQDAVNICCCCGDCCGVLRMVKKHPRPADMIASAYYAESDPEVCSACGDCVERCQMEAIVVNGYAVVSRERCIGCGLCVTTCSTDSMHLVRKTGDELPNVPKNVVEFTLDMARKKGVVSTPGLVKMQMRSTVDRLISPKE